MIACLSAVAATRNVYAQTAVLGFPNQSPLPHSPPRFVRADVNNDPYWNGAFRYIFGNGTTTLNGAFQANQGPSLDKNGNPTNPAGQSLYFSFQLNGAFNQPNGDTFNQNDAIVIAIGTGTNNFLIVVNPNVSGQPQGLSGGTVGAGVGPSQSATGNARPQLQFYYGGTYTAAGGWQNFTPAPNPPGFVLKVGNADGASFTPASQMTYPTNWTVAVEIPITADQTQGVNVPTTNNFSLYVDEISASDNTGMAPQLQWPETAPAVAGNDAGDAADILLGLPAPSSWGQGNIGSGPFNGVSLYDNLGNTNIVDITTANPTGSITLDASGLNTFQATVYNTSITTVGCPSGNTTGCPAGVSNISAKFKIANFGLNGTAQNSDWTLIPNAPVNPVTITSIDPPSMTFMPSSKVTPGVTWNTANDDASLTALYKDYPHQCILVELDGPPGTTFVNRSATQNMHFPTASINGIVKFNAQLSAKGYGAPPHGLTAHRFDVFAASQESLGEASNGPATGPNIRTIRPKAMARLNSTNPWLTYIIRGYRYTGRKVQINKHVYDVPECAGAYGYGIQHDGKELSEWKEKTTAPGLKEVSPGHFQIEVPKDGVVQLVTQIEAVELAGQGGPTPATSGSSLWWLWILLLVLVILILAYLIKKKVIPI